MFEPWSRWSSLGRLGSLALRVDTMFYRSGESHFFTELCSNLPEYIFQRVELREWLAKLRQSYVEN